MGIIETRKETVMITLSPVLMAARRSRKRSNPHPTPTASPSKMDLIKIFEKKLHELVTVPASSEDLEYAYNYLINERAHIEQHRLGRSIQHEIDDCKANIIIAKTREVISEFDPIDYELTTSLLEESKDLFLNIHHFTNGAGKRISANHIKGILISAKVTYLESQGKKIEAEELYRTNKELIDSARKFWR